jgi:hypothetical protein
MPIDKKFPIENNMHYGQPTHIEYIISQEHQND